METPVLYDGAITDIKSVAVINNKWGKKQLVFRVKGSDIFRMSTAAWCGLKKATRWINQQLDCVAFGFTPSEVEKIIHTSVGVRGKNEWKVRMLKLDELSLQSGDGLMMIEADEYSPGSWVVDIRNFWEQPGDDEPRYTRLGMWLTPSEYDALINQHLNKIDEQLVLPRRNGDMNSPGKVAGGDPLNSIMGVLDIKESNQKPASLETNTDQQHSEEAQDVPNTQRKRKNKISSCPNKQAKSHYIFNQ